MFLCGTRTARPRVFLLSPFQNDPSRSTVSAGVPYTAALLRSQGKNDVAITSALRQEGYTPAQIAKILQEMNK